MGGRPEGPDANDGPDGLAGLRWEPVQPGGPGSPGSPGSPGDWRDWLTRSSSARSLAGILAAADAAGIAVVLTLIAASLIRGRATSAGVLLVPGILLLAAGQVWAILVAMARRPPGAGRRFLGGGGSVSQDLRLLFGPVDRRVTRTVTALCVTGFLSFITAIFFTWDGGPAGSGGGCAYRLVSHGVYTCVSKTAYYLAGAAEQRIAAGVFLSFYAIHLYAALASSQAGQQAP